MPKYKEAYLFVLLHQFAASTTVLKNTFMRTLTFITTQNKKKLFNLNLRDILGHHWHALRHKGREHWRACTPRSTTRHTTKCVCGLIILFLKNNIIKIKIIQTRKHQVASYSIKILLFVGKKTKKITIVVFEICQNNIFFVSYD